MESLQAVPSLNQSEIDERIRSLWRQVAIEREKYLREEAKRSAENRRIYFGLAVKAAK